MSGPEVRSNPVGNQEPRRRRSEPRAPTGLSMHIGNKLAVKERPGAATTRQKRSRPADRHRFGRRRSIFSTFSSLGGSLRPPRVSFSFSLSLLLSFSPPACVARTELRALSLKYAARCELV